MKFDFDEKIKQDQLIFPFILNQGFRNLCFNKRISYQLGLIFFL